MVQPGQVSRQVVAWLGKYLQLRQLSKSLYDTIPNTFFGIVLWNMRNEAETSRIRYASIWNMEADRRLPIASLL